MKSSRRASQVEYSAYTITVKLPCWAYDGRTVTTALCSSITHWITCSPSHTLLCGGSVLIIIILVCMRNCWNPSVLFKNPTLPLALKKTRHNASVVSHQNHSIGITMATASSTTASKPFTTTTIPFPTHVSDITACRSRPGSCPPNGFSMTLVDERLGKNTKVQLGLLSLLLSCSSPNQPTK